MWLYFEDDEEVLTGANIDVSFSSALPKGFTLTRTEPMLARSPTTGRWESRAVNLPRFDINPISLESNGLLIEPGRTQLVYTNRAPKYTPLLATSTTDATDQTPFGLGALKLLPTATNGFHGFDFYFENPRSTVIPDNTSAAIQIVVKPVGAYNRARFFLLGRNGVYQAVEFQLTGSGSVLSSTVASASIAQDTDGYYTLKIAHNFGIGTTTPALTLSIINNAGERGFTADGTSSFYIAYLGAEYGTEATTPMVNTTTGIIQRQPETLTSNVNWIGSSQRASFALQYTPLGLGGTALEVAGAPGNSLSISSNASTGITTYNVYSSGAASANIFDLNAAPPPPGVSRTAVITMAPDEYRFAINGTYIGVDSSGTIPLGLTNISIGSGVTGDARMPMVVRRLKYWAAGLSKYAVETFSSDISLEGEPPNIPTITMQPELAVAPQQSSVTITLVIEGALTGSQVKYRTIDGTAKNGTEYSGTSGTLFLSPGQVAEQITIGLGTRLLNEDRTFILELYDQVDALVTVPQCAVTLQRVVPQGTPATNRYDFTTAFPPDWTFTRASAANYRNSAGIWVSAASGVPRIHCYSPAVTGLLLESAACDQRLFDSVNPFAVVAATNAIVENSQTPTGLRYVQWRMDSTIADHKMVGTFNTGICDWPTADTTLWFYARPVGQTYWKLRVKGIDNVWNEARFSFSGDGSTTGVDAAARAYIEQDEHFPTWFRFGMYRTQSATAGVSAEFELIAVDVNGNPIQAGNTSSGIDICHAQVEAAAGMSSPIMVAGATAKTTRAAELLKADAAASWYKNPSYSFAMHLMRLRDQPTGQRLIGFKDSSAASSSDDIYLWTIPNSLRLRIKVQGTVLPEITGVSVTFPRSPFTVLAAVGTDRVTFFQNGSKGGETALTVPPVAPQVLRVGSTEPFNTEPCSLLITTLSYWNYGLSDDDGKLYSGNLDFVPLPDQPVHKPVVSIPTNMAVTEGNFVDVPITKSGPGACSVSFRTAAQTAKYDVDYVGVGGTDPTAPRYTRVDFLTGDTVKTVRVQTIADATLDDGETFAIIIEPTGDNSCTFGNASGIVRIDDPNVPAPGTYAAAVGYGTQVDAGIGGAPYYVTSLAHSPTTVGTLAHALTQSNRHIIPEVGGIWTIPAVNGFAVSGKNLTFSGECAPKPIIVQGGDFKIGNAAGGGTNIHIRHLIFERGYDTTEPDNSDGDAVKMITYQNTSTTYIENIWFDHCATLWSNDEAMSLYPHGPNSQDGFLRKVSVTNTIIAEPLDDPSKVINPATGAPYKGHWERGTPEPDHAYGPIIGYQVHQVDFQHCLFQDCRMRAPWVDANTTTVIANNVANNCGTGCHISMNNYESPVKPFLHTCAGYLSISGPNSPANGSWRIISGLQVCPTGSKAWVKGMYAEKGPNATIAPWTEDQLIGAGINGVKKAFQYQTQSNCLVSTDGPKPADIPNAPISLLTAAQIYQRAVDNVGPWPKRRDLGPNSIRKVITKLVNKTGKYVNHESEVGGKTTATAYPTVTRSLRTGSPKHIDGTTAIAAYPADYATNKAAVRAWLKTFNDQVQHDPTYG